MRMLTAATAFLVVLPGQVCAWAQLDAAEIVRRSVEANERNYAALPRFNYLKVERVPDGSTRTYDELMLYGSRYSRLVAINSEPLSSERQQEEQRRLDEVTRRRSAESAAERAKRVRIYEQERARDQLLLNEMARAFDFTLVGEERLGSWDAYVLKATPRRGYKAPDMRARVLTGMVGTLWIEKSSFQWVRVEAEVIRPVSIQGFLAKVQPGTKFRLDQEPVAEGLWLPTHYSMTARARVLFFFSKNSDEEESYSGYRPAEITPNG